MYELKKIGKVFTSKFVGTGPSSYNKRIYRAAVSQSLRNTALYASGVVFMRFDIQSVPQDPLLRLNPRSKKVSLLSTNHKYKMTVKRYIIDSNCLPPCSTHMEAPAGK